MKSLDIFPEKLIRRNCQFFGNCACFSGNHLFSEDCQPVSHLSTCLEPVLTCFDLFFGKISRFYGKFRYFSGEIYGNFGRIFWKSCLFFGRLPVSYTIFNLFWTCLPVYSLF